MKAILEDLRNLPKKSKVNVSEVPSDLNKIPERPTEVLISEQNLFI